MASHMHPDGSPTSGTLSPFKLTKGVHTPGIMSPIDSPLVRGKAAPLCAKGKTSCEEEAGHMQPNTKAFTDLTNTDAEHAVVEVDLPAASSSGMEEGGFQSDTFDTLKKPPQNPNPDAATSVAESPLGKGTSTEIALNDGVVNMNAEASAVSRQPDQRQQLKVQFKDKLTNELEEVSTVLNDDEQQQQQQHTVRSGNLKDKLVDMDSTLFHDSDMKKVDLSGVLSEDDEAIADEIRNAQSSRGVQLDATEQVQGVPEATSFERDGDESEYSNNDKKTSAPYYRPKSRGVNKATAKKNDSFSLNEEDEKMINDILAKSNMMDTTGKNKNGRQRDDNVLKRTNTHISGIATDNGEITVKNNMEKPKTGDETMKRSKGNKCRKRGKNRKICPEFEAAPTIQIPVKSKTTPNGAPGKEAPPSRAQKERAGAGKLADNEKEREAPSIEEKKMESEQEKALEMKLKAKGRTYAGKTHYIASGINKVKGKPYQEDHSSSDPKSKSYTKLTANTRDSHTGANEIHGNFADINREFVYVKYSAETTTTLCNSAIHVSKMSSDFIVNNSKIFLSFW